MSRSVKAIFLGMTPLILQDTTQFNMLVSYTYRSDDPAPSEGNDGDGPSKTSTKPPEVKTFAFYTVVDLGQIIPREGPKPESDV
jgi:dynactin-4